MADRITDERLRDFASSSPLVLAIAAQMGEPSWADVRAIAAELLAARARIAKLEQEPPMAMIDFGVGVNWKGINDERKRLRAELDAARADLREAMELLRAHGQAPGWLLSVGKFEAVKDWNRRYGELLAKHKETP